ncbi:MAG: AMIN domain-containing protein [Cyanobacteriota bacterium]
MIAQPVSAASTQVKDIQLAVTDSGFQLLLETSSGEELPQIFTVSRDKEFVADIVNTQLNWEQQNNRFQQNNPVPGIASVEVSQLDANSIRVVVTGESSPPNAQILQQEDNRITLGFATGESNNSASNSISITPDQIAQGVPTIPQTSPPQSPANTNPPDAETPVPQPPGQAPRPDVLVPNPRVTIEGRPASPQNIVQPASPAPPFLPRAVAPPVGDIAVSNIDTTPESIDLGTGVRVPRLVLRDAPVREVLGLLARAADLNLVFTGAGGGAEAAPDAAAGEGAQATGATISLDLENEPVQDVFNTVLLVSGLEANRRGNTIFVGSDLPTAARNLVTRTFRLNQVDAVNAAEFLAGFAGGAAEEPADAAGAGGAGRLLTGLNAVVDERLNAITLVGEPRQVQVATSFLTQLDARRRQVAVNVKIVDINLSNQENFNSSFSFGIGDNFFSVDNGQATIGVGELAPPSASQVRDNRFNRPLIPNPGVEQQVFLDPDSGLFLQRDPNTGELVRVGQQQPTDAPTDPFTPGVTQIDRGTLPADPVAPQPATYFAIQNGEAVPVELQQLQGFGGTLRPLVDPNTGGLVLAQEAQPFQPGTDTLYAVPSLGIEPSPLTDFRTELNNLNLTFEQVAQRDDFTVTPGEQEQEALAPQYFDVDGEPRLLSQLRGFGTNPDQAIYEPLLELETGDLVEASPLIERLPGLISEAAELTYSLANFIRYPRQFLAQLRAQILSGNAKILTDPTLVVQEGEVASVQLTQEVFAGTELVTRAVGEDSVTVEQPVIKDAGLILDVEVKRIDDNGFVTMEVQPTVSAPGVSQETPVGTITLIQERTVRSGDVRMRDGQTMILSGIIQESDQTTVSKVPILGDLPILGALFRSTNRTNQRREVIVLVTPQIMDDSERSTFGYTYTPGVETRRILEQRGFPVQAPPER